MFVVKHAAPSPAGHRTTNHSVSNKFSRARNFPHIMAARRQITNARKRYS
jgi:hypothetical protein